MKFIQESSVDLCNKWQCHCIEANGEEDLLFRYASTVVPKQIYRQLQKRF